MLQVKSKKRTFVQNSVAEVGFPAIYNNIQSNAVHNDASNFLHYLSEHNKIGFMLSTSVTLRNKSDMSVPCRCVQSVTIYVNTSRVH